MHCSCGFAMRGLRPCRGCSAGISRTSQVPTLCRSQVARVRMREQANAQVSGIGESILSPGDGPGAAWRSSGGFAMRGLRPCRGCSAGISRTSQVPTMRGSKVCRVRMPEQANAQVSGTGDHLRSRKTGLSAGLRYMAGSTCRPTTTMSWAGSAGWRCRGRTVVAAVRSVEPDVRERGQVAGDIALAKLLARSAAMGKVVDPGLRGHGDVVSKAARLEHPRLHPAGH